MNTSIANKIETAILENCEIINVCSNSKYCNHAFVSDITAK